MATSLNNLGNRLSQLGRHEAALTSAEEAVAIRRRLAQANPTAHLPHLAGSLINFGDRLSELGLREVALTSTKEATGIYRRLAQANPAHQPDLARGLWGFASVRVAGGLELPEALAAMEEAIALYQRLAEELPDAFGGDLPAARYTLADMLDGLSRDEETTEVRCQIGGDAASEDDAVP